MFAAIDISIVSGYLLAIVASLAMCRTACLFLPPAGHPVLKVIIGAVFWLVFCLPAWIGDENILLIFPVVLAAVCLCYRGPLYARTIASVLFYTLLLPINILLDTTFQITLGIYDRVLLANLLKLAIWLGIYLLARRLLRVGETIQLSARLWALVGALSLAPLFTTLSFSIWNMRFFGEDVYYSIMKRLCYTTLPFTLLSALALLVALAVLARHEALQRDKQLADMQRLYTQSLQNEQAEVRTLRHDMNNHIGTAEGMLAAGNSKGALKYLQALSGSPALAGTARLCENDTANAVLGAKMATIQREGLNADWKLTLPGNLPLPDIDLCALLGNALDNAIEAAKEAQDKTVTLRARADKGMLMLRVRNALPAGQVPQKERGRWVTTKADHKAHGFGLATIEAIAGRHGGSLEVSTQNGRFELMVCVPLPGPGGSK